MPLAHIPSIKGPRVTVRPVAAADLEDLMAVNGDPEVTRFLPYRTWDDMADARAWLERMSTLAEAGTSRQLVVACNASRRAIGTILLFRYDESSARVELGYALAKARWSQGIAHEALGLVLQHALRAMSVRRVEAEVSPANTASCALLAKLGFVQEGLLRERWIDHHIPCSVYMYGLLESDWVITKPMDHERSGAASRIARAFPVDAS